MFGRGSVVILYFSARLIGNGMIPNVSFVAIRVGSMRGIGKEVSVPRRIAISVISSFIHRS